MSDQATTTAQYVSVPIRRWGQDHWSTLLYVETRVVDHSGILVADHLRSDGGKYPTRIKAREVADETGDFGSEEVFGHSDYDCLKDLVLGGFLTIVDGDVQSRAYIGNHSTRAHYEAYGLTPKGWAVVSLARQHKATNGNLHTFQPPMDIVIPISHGRSRVARLVPPAPEATS